MGDTFGYTTLGSLASTLDNQIDGSQFTCLHDGTGNSIIVGLKYSGGVWTGKVKCAIYLASNLSAPITNGQTEERTLTLTSSATWYTFNLPSAPTFVANTAYVLCAWAENATNTAQIVRDDDASVNRWYYARTYDGWPSLSASDRTGKYSIYCDYTTSGGNDIYAESGYWSDIQDAVDLAEEGDNVRIPEGTYNFVNVDESWTGARVVIPAGVNLFGALTERDGNNQVVEWKTVLKLPWDMPNNDAIWFQFGAEGVAVSKFTRFSDIKLVGYRYYNNNAIHYYNGIKIRDILGFRIDHCCLQDVCGNGITATGSSIPSRPESHYMVQGVVDHCRLVNSKAKVAPYESRTVGYGIYVNRGSGYLYEGWESDITEILGKYLNYTVFVEDCYLSKWRHCVVCRQGGHAVFRYSTVQYDQGYGSVDIHGDYSGRAYEIYNVDLLDAVQGEGGTYGEGIWWRAGGGVVFDNSISGGVYDLFLLLTNENPNPDYQVFDVWIWDNTVEEGITYVSTSGSNPPVLNEDYFLREPNIEDDGFTYTPYTYPHPLVGAGGGGWQGKFMGVTNPTYIKGVSTAIISKVMGVS